MQTSEADLVMCLCMRLSEVVSLNRLPIMFPQQHLALIPERNQLYHRLIHIIDDMGSESDHCIHTTRC